MTDHLERIGQAMGDYRLVHWLGGGGFGNVYLAEHIHGGEQVALKVMEIRLTKDEDFRAFLNEARMMRLHHPHIVPLLDFGLSHEGTPFLVMEYAPLGTLRDRHPKGSRVPLLTVVEYAEQVASALSYAHTRRVVHRDVKPENMLVRADGEILLSDFGIATTAHSTHSLSANQGIGGTIPYMAPEQLEGRPRTESDQYALGIVIYEWLAGRCPFRGTAVEVAMQHTLRQPPSLVTLVPDLPIEVEEVLFKALAKNPRDRFASMQVFLQALQEASEYLPTLEELSDEPFLKKDSPVTPLQPKLPPTVVAHPTAPRRHKIDTEADSYAGYEVYRRPASRSGTRSSAPPQPTARPAKRRARRSVWSILLMGVIGGIITVALVGIGWFFLIHTPQVGLPSRGIGMSKYTSPQQTVPLNITSSITQLQIMNDAGNISISDDNNIITGGTLTYVKKTQASSASNATSDFASIQVRVQPGTSAACPETSCMAVSVGMPSNISASVDLTIILPAQGPTPQFVLNAATQMGNIGVQGFAGLLTLTTDSGNVDVKGGLLAPGSCLQDRFGNIASSATLETGIAPTIIPCLGSPVTTSGSLQPWYSFKDGTGNLDVSLNSISANIILDAVVFNQGKITSDYPIAISSASPPSYVGPLLPGTQPTALLLLAVDTGNITLHKV